MRVCLAALAALILSATDAHPQACSELETLVNSFRQMYPTGGPVERFAGARGQQVLDRLAVTAPGRQVAFLYSGDGPRTGARGRYLYVVLDADDCILNHDWIDGEVYDRALRQ